MKAGSVTSFNPSSNPFRLFAIFQQFQIILAFVIDIFDGVNPFGDELKVEAVEIFFINCRFKKLLGIHKRACSFITMLNVN